MNSIRIDPNAERLSAWAYKRLLNGWSEPDAYPLKGCQAAWKRGSGWSLTAAPHRNVKKQSRTLTANQALREIEQLRKTMSKAVQQIARIRSHADAADLTTHGFAVHLGEFVHALQSELSALTERGNEYAAEWLSFNAGFAANELEPLERKEPSARVIKLLAPQKPFWPVLYSPHHDDERELKARITKLHVGTRSPEKMNSRWSNRPSPNQPFREILGTYAGRIAFTLREIHEDENLRRVLKHRSEGWPEWIVELCKLPSLTAESAPAWFDCGWKALLEASGGRVGAIEELRPAGKSNAEYRQRREDTKRTQQTQAESQIKARLRDAFLKRFGNPG